MRETTPGAGNGGGPSNAGGPASPKAPFNGSPSNRGRFGGTGSHAPRVLLNAVRVATGAVLMWAVLTGLHVDVSDPTEGAMLRVALRTNAGTAQVCRRVSPEELEKTAVHMRRAEICETHAVPYRLEVRAGSSVLIDQVYSAAGLHGDRPLSVNENLMLDAGRHDVSIRFAPAVSEDMTSDKVATLPPAFTFADTVEFPEGRIRVASLDVAKGAFEIR